MTASKNHHHHHHHQVIIFYLDYIFLRENSKKNSEKGSFRLTAGDRNSGFATVRLRIERWRLVDCRQPGPYGEARRKVRERQSIHAKQLSLNLRRFAAATTTTTTAKKQ
jgi:hypothetical protein